MEFMEAPRCVWGVMNNALTVHMIKGGILVRELFCVALLELCSEPAQGQPAASQLHGRFTEVTGSYLYTALRELLYPKANPTAYIKHRTSRGNIARENGVNRAIVLMEYRSFMLLKKLLLPGEMARFIRE
jgi:hypothetical protein